MQAGAGEKFMEFQKCRQYYIEAHSYVASMAPDMLCCFTDLSFLGNQWVDEAFVGRQRGEKCTEFQK